VTENIDNCETIPEVPAKPATPPKRTVREFLNQYRALGLPGAKQMCRRTRLQEAAYRHSIDVKLIEHLIGEVKRYMLAMEELEKESNWMCKEEENQEITLIWVGEGDPLEIIKRAKQPVGN